MEKKLIPFILVFLLASCALAEDNAGKSGFPYWLISPPIPGYSQETGWSAMLVAMVMYLDGDDKKTTYPSVFFPKITYTQKNQLDTAVEVDHYARDNAWFLKALAGYRRYPDRFFGTGRISADEEGESYTLETITGWLEYYLKISGNFHAGARLRLQKDALTEAEQGGLLSSGAVYGYRGLFNPGLGLLFKIDDRDNTMMVMSGDYHVISAEIFAPPQAQSFVIITADLRKYFKTAERQSLGLRLFSENTMGRPPFNMLSIFGGSTRLKGYLYGKYRDNNSFFACAEYKAVLLDWLGATAFAGLGDTMAYWGAPLEIKYSAGAGLRIIVDSSNMTNLRVDAAFGRDSMGFYIDLNDTF
ncbi:MAG TPA: hypothetical protein P5511_01480 [Candidatus Goldiibacteriota bacterium]|nr:hypothetical protein [Candidatus Goldiibacteriota bacterium]